jgi:hypothetical protein
MGIRHSGVERLLAEPLYRRFETSLSAWCWWCNQTLQNRECRLFKGDTQMNVSVTLLTLMAILLAAAAFIPILQPPARRLCNMYGLLHPSVRLTQVTGDKYGRSHNLRSYDHYSCLRPSAGSFGCGGPASLVTIESVFNRSDFRSLEACRRKRSLCAESYAASRPPVNRWAMRYTMDLNTCSAFRRSTCAVIH